MLRENAAQALGGGAVHPFSAAVNDLSFLQMEVLFKLRFDPDDKAEEDSGLEKDAIAANERDRQEAIDNGVLLEDEDANGNRFYTDIDGKRVDHTPED